MSKQPTISELAAETGASVDDVSALVDQLQTLDDRSQVLTGDGSHDDPRLTSQAADIIRQQLGE